MHNQMIFKEKTFNYWKIAFLLRAKFTSKFKVIHIEHPFYTLAISKSNCALEIHKGRKPVFISKDLFKSIEK